MNTRDEFMNRKSTRKHAMQTRLIRADEPTANVAKGLREEKRLAHVPSHINLYVYKGFSGLEDEITGC